MQRMLVVIGVAAGLSLLAAPASAVHSAPAKAKSLKAELVPGYAACTSPNDTTGGLGLPACSPPVRNDPVCSFGPKGAGKIAAKVIGKAAAGTGDIAVNVKIKGLQGCDGETLCPVASFRATTDNCASGIDCTSVDVPNLPLGFPPNGCCTVLNGACKIKTTVNTNVPGAIVSSNNTVIEILGCGVHRTSGAPPAVAPSFACGLKVP